MELKDVVGQVAGLFQVAQMFAGLFVCKQIRERNSSDHLPPMTFLNGLMMSVLMFEQGRILKMTKTSWVFYIGFVLVFIYNTTYFKYANSQTRKKYLRNLSILVALLSSIIFYAEVWEDSTKLPMRYGMIIMGVMVYMLIFPALGVKKIIQTKNSESLPFPMLLVGTLGSSTWLLYGVLSGLPSIIYQNIFMLTFMLFYLSICFIYPAKKVNKDDKKNE